jgi:hypothetical protein
MTHMPDPPTNAADVDTEMEKQEHMKDMNRCDVCKSVMCRPIFLPLCGHSPCCQECAVLTKIKKCGRCGEAVKTPPARLKVNFGLSSLLRCMFPNEYSASTARPSDDALLHEIQRNTAVERLDIAICRAGEPGPYHAFLSSNYRSSALKIIDTEYSETNIGTHVVRWCDCGLVELPKYSAKSGRHFFGCPAWSPMSCKRKRDDNDNAFVPEDTKYCGSFAHISQKQKEALKLVCTRV